MAVDEFHVGPVRPKVVDPVGMEPSDDPSAVRCSPSCEATEPPSTQPPIASTSTSLLEVDGSSDLKQDHWCDRLKARLSRRWVRSTYPEPEG